MLQITSRSLCLKYNKTKNSLFTLHRLKSILCVYGNNNNDTFKMFFTVFAPCLKYVLVQTLPTLDTDELISSEENNP